MSKKVDSSEQFNRLEGMIAQLVEMVGKQNVALNDLKVSMNHRFNQLETKMDAGFREVGKNFAALGEVLGDVHMILTRQVEHQAETQERVITLESGK